MQLMTEGEFLERAGDRSFIHSKWRLRACMFSSSKRSLFLSSCRFICVMPMASVCWGRSNKYTSDLGGLSHQDELPPSIQNRDAGRLRSRHWQVWILLSVFHASLSFSSCFWRSSGSLPWPLPACVSTSKFPLSRRTLGELDEGLC